MLVMAEEAPPKRGPERPPGAKNKATLLREMDSSIPQPQMFHEDCFDIMSDDERIPAGSVNLEDIPDYQEMEEVAEARGLHADFYDHE